MAETKGKGKREKEVLKILFDIIGIYASAGTNANPQRYTSSSFLKMRYLRTVSTKKGIMKKHIKSEF